MSILPLTSVKAHQGTLISKIESMKPTGTTNVTIGLTWGWHALTPNLPMTEGTAPNPDTDKVIILLTDGDNTENRWTTNSVDIDARTKKVCANVKAAGIKLYTVRVIDGNATLLQQCATRTDMYFNVQNASQLNGVFSQIANSLANLRIPSKSQNRQPSSKSPASWPGFFSCHRNRRYHARCKRRRTGVHWNAMLSLALNCAFSKLSRSSRRCGLSVERPAICG